MSQATRPTPSCIATSASASVPIRLHGIMHICTGIATGEIVRGEQVVKPPQQVSGMAPTAYFGRGSLRSNLLRIVGPLGCGSGFDALAQDIKLRFAHRIGRPWIELDRFAHQECELADRQAARGFSRAVQ